MVHNRDPTHRTLEKGRFGSFYFFCNELWDLQYSIDFIVTVAIPYFISILVCSQNILFRETSILTILEFAVTLYQYKYFSSSYSLT